MNRSDDRFTDRRAEPYANEAPPDSAYVHVPFCRHRCGYCNFTLLAGRDDRIEDYLDAIERELEPIPRTPVETLFFGGGTPSHLSVAAIGRLAGLVERTFPRRDTAEVSYEANPRDLLLPGRLEALVDAGATRLSLGVQSFSPRKLALLERDHDAALVRQVIERARPLIDSLSIDLIFGTPGETADEWERDLDAALELPIDHVSTYGLTIEKGTAFYGRTLRGGLVVAEDEVQAHGYERGIERLSAAGFEHYEVSNFARSGHRCRHNETYWTDRPWHAIGPGAARFLNSVRETNHRSTFTWIARLKQGLSPVAERDVLSSERRARDRFVFGMRRLEGIDVEAFAAATGRTARSLAPAAWDRALEQGWFVERDRRVRLTPRGLLISDSLWPDFLDTDDPDAPESDVARASIDERSE
ncbi:MAG TPA: coproporphyrinogen III oxidase [Planctomycetaceae bacterium]|nr:coproporphyrinogen III oxidase [Planctomycetaceae bacterium]HRF00288.1 radical SAM family heme chaperone HemW [Pirellulaceae bacterium]